MKKTAKRRSRRKRCLLLLAGLLVLEGCGGIEPEKRAFPLAVSVDVEEGEFLVSYAMANLPLMTGQSKDQEESGEEQNTGSTFRGKTFDEIRKQYEDSQEYELDLGHVKALVLGETLLQDQRWREELFEEIEKSPVLGKNLYLFRTQTPSEVMEQNGKEKDSIGDFLAGFYENRSGNRNRIPVTLEDFFYVWSNEGRVPELPELVCRDGQIFLCGEEE